MAQLPEKMDEVEWSAFFSSPSKTMLHVELSTPVDRSCFSYGQKRAGGNVFVQACAPGGWSRTTNAFLVVRLLHEFVTTTWNVEFRGQHAPTLLERLKAASPARKRDAKYLFKRHADRADNNEGQK